MKPYILSAPSFRSKQTISQRYRAEDVTSLLRTPLDGRDNGSLIYIEMSSKDRQGADRVRNTDCLAFPTMHSLYDRSSPCLAKDTRFHLKKKKKDVLHIVHAPREVVLTIGAG